MLRKPLCLFILLLLFASEPAKTSLASPVLAVSRRKQVRRSAALWPGSRFTEADRRRAVLWGLDFIYRTSLDRKNFADYGPDYIWCFYTLSVAVRDRQVRRRARRMGLERAAVWRRAHRSVSVDADASTISTLAYGNDAAESLGVYDREFKRQLKSAAARFKARDYLLFDPLREPPPDDIPSDCKRCGASNGRSAKVCFVCRTPLVMRTRYDIWYDALITAYVGERSGIDLGARYADVLKWLPTLRPYKAKPEDEGEEFHDTVYAITHIVYTLNNYNQYRLSPSLLPQEFEFLKANFRVAIVKDDADMLGELMDVLRAFGLKTSDPLIREGMEYYLTHQNRDGSWGDRRERDIYLRYHPTWNAVAGLSEYAWAGEGLSFPDVRPLLERWALADASAESTFSHPSKSSPARKSARMPLLLEVNRIKDEHCSQ
jgi:hypothetical protein